MPAYQGELDGLCGPYAVANALEFCGLGRERQALFNLACEAIPTARWPLSLWHGTTYGDLRRMVTTCLRSPLNKEGVKARYPLARAKPATNSGFWRAFDEAFSDSRAVCGLVGLISPSPHWIVAIPDGGRVAFIDSTPERPIYRKNRCSLRAGYRRQRPNEWLLDRNELVVLLAS